MTDEQRKKYTEVKERLRRLGKENPADAILYLATEVDLYRAKIRRLEEFIDKLQVVNKLHEADNADLQKQLEQKVEEVYPEFMRDYKYMCEELDSVYDELEELTKELDKRSAPQESLWQLNLDNLRAGLFGPEIEPETMFRYWKAQEAAGYPNASENVHYFTSLVKKEGISEEVHPDDT